MATALRPLLKGITKIVPVKANFNKESFMRRFSIVASILAFSVALAIAARLPRVFGGQVSQTQEKAPSEPAEQSATERFQIVINRMVEDINKPDYVGIQQDFDEEMLKALPLEECTAFFKDLLSQYGKIERIDSPRFIPPDQAIFPAHFQRGVLDIKLVLDNEDKIAGLWFLPHAFAIPVPDKHKTQLSLPFKGRWLVFWGGDTKELNQHHDTTNQRFAFDFLGAGNDGKTRKGDGSLNEDYFAFGRQILAPADGIVTDVINGVRDNAPRSMNPYSALGNAVFIEHRPYEVSVLAHLKLDSIKVKVGDRVEKGQLIALCGNSGNSSEPHLHYHLQNTPIIQDGTGIKPFFQSLILIKDGKKEQKTNYSPTKGEIIFAE